MGKRPLAIVACVAVTLGACRKPPIVVVVRQPGTIDPHFGQIVVRVPDDDGNAVVKVNGERARRDPGDPGEWVTAYLPALPMPLGPNQLHVTVFTTRLGTRTQDVPFDRAPVDAFLKIDALSGPPPLKPPPLLKPTATPPELQSDEGACRGDVCACAGVTVDADGAAHMRVRAAIGATVEIEGQKLVVPDPVDDPRAREPFVVPLASKLADVALDRLAEGDFVDVHAKVTTDATKEYTFGIGAVVFQGAVARLARKVTSGPVLPDGAETPAPARSVLLVREEKVELLGAPAKLRDVDLIAVDDLRPSRTLPSCGPYGDDPQSGVVIAHLVADEEIAVHERRTGKLLGKRRFPGKARNCPKSVLVRTTTHFRGWEMWKTSRADDAVDPAPPEVVAAWLQTML